MRFSEPKSTKDSNQIRGRQMDLAFLSKLYDQSVRQASCMRLDMSSERSTIADTAPTVGDHQQDSIPNEASQAQDPYPLARFHRRLRGRELGRRRRILPPNINDHTKNTPQQPETPPEPPMMLPGFSIRSRPQNPGSPSSSSEPQETPSTSSSNTAVADMPSQAQPQTHPLPYKLVVFKNSIQAGDWDCADVHAFDQKENIASDKDSASLLVLTEFCASALAAIQRYLQSVNRDMAETPTGYSWCVYSVHIERGRDGLLSCKEFAIVVELVRRTRFEGEEADISM